MYGATIKRGLSGEAIVRILSAATKARFFVGATGQSGEPDIISTVEPAPSVAVIELVIDIEAASRVACDNVAVTAPAAASDADNTTLAPIVADIADCAAKPADRITPTLTDALTELDAAGDAASLIVSARPAVSVDVAAMLTPSEPACDRALVRLDMAARDAASGMDRLRAADALDEATRGAARDMPRPIPAVIADDAPKDDASGIPNASALASEDVAGMDAASGMPTAMPDDSADDACRLAANGIDRPSDAAMADDAASDDARDTAPAVAALLYPIGAKPSGSAPKNIS